MMEVESNEEMRASVEPHIYNTLRDLKVRRNPDWGKWKALYQYYISSDTNTFSANWQPACVDHFALPVTSPEL